MNSHPAARATALERRAAHHAILERTVHPTGHFTPIEPHEIDQPVTRKFEAQVRKFPDRVALKSKYQQMSYVELNRAANRIAHALLARRGPGAEPVVLMLEHDVWIVAAIYGVLKAGKFFVVLDKAQPDARLLTILADVEAALILTDKENRAHAAALAGRMAGAQASVAPVDVIAVDALEATLCDDNPDLEIDPAAYAYIIYTSGTSGVPKGVIENHRDVMHFVRVRVNSIHFCPEDRILQLQPFSFSGAMSATFGAPICGASLYIYEPKREGIRNLIEWLIQEEITTFIGVPPLFRQMLAALKDNEQFPAMRAVWLGGDRVFAADLEAFRRVFARTCVFRNGYGASEIKVIAEYVSDHTLPIPAEGIPAGYVVTDTEVLLLDEQGNPVDTGEVGEIVVRSRYVCPGYWRRPELTAAKFATDPTDPDKRLYWTGDLGRFDDAGCLFHLGRKDFQVKVRGQRVEVEEIENALVNLPGIGEAAVTLHHFANDKFGSDERLVAYLAATPDCPPDPSLRQQLAALLPPYMVPNHFVRLPALPHNVNGKIDRLALPAPDDERPALANPFEAATTPLEMSIAALWSRLLGIHPVGVTDDFFDLGGHSLLAIQMLAALEQERGQKIPVAALVQGRTVRGMAAWLEGSQPADRPRMLVPIQEGGSRIPLCVVPPLAASALSFVELARALGPDQPFYAIDDAVLPDQVWTVEEIAAYYLGELTAVQPTGPYLLGGRCFGAKIALEMTRQLEDAGQTVRLLVLMEDDAPEPARPSGVRANAVRYARRLQRHWREGTLQVLLRAHARWRWRKLTGRVQWDLTKRNIVGWQPRAVQTPVMLYMSKEFYQLGYHERWLPWAAGKFEMKIIDGTTHDTLWQPDTGIAEIACDLAPRIQALGVTV